MYGRFLRYKSHIKLQSFILYLVLFITKHWRLLFSAIDTRLNSNMRCMWLFSHVLQRKTKIFVGRLPENCRNEELRQLFLRFGEVTECDVMNRYGFVHMAREEDAAAAIKALHNSNFKGATINVEQSTGKSRGGGGGRRDDRRGGPMRGGRGGRDGGRDARPGPYNDRRGWYCLRILIRGHDTQLK